MFDSIAFIGAGRIAHIMLGGWQRANALPANIVAFDAKPDAVKALQDAFPNVRTATLAEASRASLVFGALHPPAMGEALAEIGHNLPPHAVFCSLAPVIRLPALQQKLGGFARVARLNPNATSIACAGFNPISFSSGLPQDARTALLALLAPLGDCPVVDDGMIETYAAVSAMGPTYFWFQFDQLRQMAESWGLTPEKARETVAAMLHGAVDTMFGTGLPPDRVMDLIPVRPMADDEEAIRGMLQSRIAAVHARLHPAG